MAQKIEQNSVDPTGEFPFAAGDYVLHLLAIISQFRDSTLDRRLRPLGLNISRYRAIAVLRRFGSSTMTEIANFTGMDRTTLTRIADQLVTAGWAERMSEAKDRRQVLLRLTDAGHETAAKAVKILVDVNAQFLKSLPDVDLRATARVLVEVVDNFAPSPLVRDGIIHFDREMLGPADI